jgi:polyhydroxyalkanoate synthesis repressor PhaR
MVRLIKRYESRKLYDTEESRYVSLEEIADWVRRGQSIEVVDNATGEDATAQTLTQVILEEGRNGHSTLPTELLHDLVRFGARAFSSGVEHVQHGVDRFVQGSIDRLTPVREAREEMSALKERLEELEASLHRIEVAGGAPAGARRRQPASTKAPRKRAGKRGAAGDDPS